MVVHDLRTPAVRALVLRFAGEPVDALDETLADADWARATWDLDEDPDEFLAFLEASELTLEEFTQLPAWAAAPPAIKALLEEAP